MLQSIDFNVTYGAENNPYFKEADAWTCTFGYDGREIGVAFYMGVGHGGKEPEKEDVLDALFMDASAKDFSFEEWCAEFGYNDDSISALETYKACLNHAEELEYLLGSNYDSVRDEVQELV